jgi:hypothetical protein
LFYAALSKEKIKYFGDVFLNIPLRVIPFQ